MHAGPFRQSYSAPPFARGMGRTAAICGLCGTAFKPYGGKRHSYCKRCTARTDKKIGAAKKAECGECGKRFAARSRAARYCSDQCRAAVKARHTREYYRASMADPEKRAIKMAHTRVAVAAYRARKRGMERTADGGTGMDRQGAWPAPDTLSECALCGRRFRPHWGRIQVHCKRCMERAEREIRRKRAVKCGECGKAFSTSNRAVRYCSRACREDSGRRRDRENRRRKMANPERRAMAAAYQRAADAARRDGKEKKAGRGRTPA